MASPSSTVPPPVSHARLREIATSACDQVFKDATGYEHSRTEQWNTEIINTILQSLIRETTSRSGPPPYKFAINSTIIQHASPVSSTASNTIHPKQQSSVSDFIAKKEENTLDQKPFTPEAPAPAANMGRRGMHSATGAYWNNEKDGMWNFKYEAIENRGLDVVVSIIWISI